MKIILMVMTLILSTMANAISGEVGIITWQNFIPHRIKLIRDAKPDSEILIAQYIFMFDDTGKVILKELIAAAARGVKIKVLIDGIGEGPTLSYDNDDYSALKALGVEMKIFNPKGLAIHKLRKRMHHKVFIANDQLIVGSSSIYNASYSGITEMDLALKGADLLKDATTHFYEFWNSENAKSVGGTANESIISLFQKKLNKIHFYLQEAAASESRDISFSAFPEVRYAKDGPGKSRSISENINGDIFKLISEAKENITIVSPYPFFSAEFKALLDEQSKKGIKITLITANREIISQEHKSILETFNRQIKFFRESKITVKESHAFLHVKTIKVDDRHIYLGSHNLDYLGFYDNAENGVILTNIPDSSEFLSLYNRYLDAFSASPVIIEDGEMVSEMLECKGMACGLWRFAYPAMSKEN